MAKQELRLFLKKIKRCSCCNSMYFMYGYDNEDRIVMMMNKNNICYNCAYWQDIIHYPPQYMEIVGTKCIKVLPVVEKRDKSILLGGKGKMRYFARPDLSLVQSNDIWTIGTIPENFRDKLPPTLVEVTKRTYDKLKKGNNKNKCSARGCFDRYNCLRYDLEIEKDHIGAFNQPPPTWKVGKERCRYFINMAEMTSDDGSGK